MPRSRRHIPPDSVVHVLNRGNDRRTLFAGPAEYREFLGLMQHAIGRTSLRVLAYVLMPNHWHLVAWPEEQLQLSRFLQVVCTAHAARWRRRIGQIGAGHVYQDRYHAFLVESERQYFNVLRYVEANPLRAGLVDSADAWRWSSLAERLSDSRTLLTAGPLPLPDGWPALVAEAVRPADLADLQQRTKRIQRAAWQPHRRVSR